MGQLDMTIVELRTRAQGEMLLGATDDEVVGRYSLPPEQVKRWRLHLQGRKDKIADLLDRQGDSDLAMLVRGKQRSDKIVTDLSDLMPAVAELIPAMVRGFGERLQIYNSPEFIQRMLDRGGPEGLEKFEQRLDARLGHYLKLASMSAEGVALGFGDGTVQLPARPSASTRLIAGGAVEGGGSGTASEEGSPGDPEHDDGPGDGRDGGDSDSGDNGSGGNGHL